MTTEDGKTLSERCHLAIPISPGMRPGTQFIFEFEGDDGPGIVPGDVKVERPNVSRVLSVPLSQSVRRWSGWKSWM